MILDLLTDMVRIPSLSGDEAALGRFLAERMDTLGFDARVDSAGNAVGEWVDREDGLPDGERRHLVLLGHMDTVPGGPAVELREGRLYGRGTVDAKGPLATFIAAVAGMDPIPGWRVTVIGAVEEEVASSKGARHVATRLRPDACIIGEPSGWDAVTLGYKGRLLVDAEISRPTDHSAGPEPSAAERLVDFWGRVCELCDAQNAGRPDCMFHRLQRRLDRIDSGTSNDREWARATVGFRLPPGIAPETLADELRRLAASLPVPPDLEVRGAEVAWVSERGSPLVSSFSRALRAEGLRPRLKHKTGTSDMNVVGPVWQCPIVAYGPGDSSLDHTPEEHVEVADLDRAVQVLRRAILELTSRTDL